MEEFRTDDGPIGGELERLAKTVSTAIAIPAGRLAVGSVGRRDDRGCQGGCCHREDREGTGPSEWFGAGAEWLRGHVGPPVTGRPRRGVT